MRKLIHAEIKKKRLKPVDVASARRVPVVVVVDSIRSLYNVGSIFRTSDGAMIQELILTGFTPTPPRKEIEKTALGATTTVPWTYVKDPLQAITSLSRRGFRICCLEITDKSIPYDAITPDYFPLCLVIGNELAGVSREIIDRCDVAIDIPMFGIKHSLNVAVAYGVAVFELAKIWRTGQSA